MAETLRIFVGGALQNKRLTFYFQYSASWDSRAIGPTAIQQSNYAAASYILRLALPNQTNYQGRATL